jgi:hypothetical protein
MLFVAFLVWIPQFLYWKEVTGNYLFYSYTDEGFFFNHPRILEGLFSFRKGWLLYTPMMAFPLIGLFFRKPELKGLRFPLFLFTALNIYIIFSWWCWWYGGTFGQRGLVESYALLAIPFASVIKSMSEQKLGLKIVFTVVCLFFIWLNIFQMYQYEKLTLHWDGMTKELYFKQFGKMDKIPNYDKYVSLPNNVEAKKGNDCATPQQQMPPPATPEPLKSNEKHINIKAANGKFLCADENKDLVVYANRDEAQGWETFTFSDLGNNMCQIRNHNNLFFSALLSRKNELAANANRASSWETFTFVKADDTHIALKAANGKYLSLDTISLQLIANADTIIGKNEKFELIEK